MTKVAAIQMCSSHNVDDNLEIAENLINEAAKQSAKLIVLPEMFAIVGLQDVDKTKYGEDFGAGKIQNFLSAQAKKHQVWIVGGTIPIKSNNKNKVSATCLLYNDQGEVILRYDKIHLFDVTISTTEVYQESAAIEPGSKAAFTDTPFGKIGLAVCYDVRFPELFRFLFNSGVEIICIPAAFTVKTGEAHWELLARSRAVENFCYVIGACQGGTHTSGRRTYGHSLIVGPWGSVLATINGTETGIIYADIDLAKLYEIRKAIPVAEHQKEIK